MLFKTFIDRIAGWNEAAFLDRFTHPFLLEITDDELSRRIYRVHSRDGKPLVVGRGPRCHLRIIEKSISTTHASLIPPSSPKGSWHVMDKGSSNGTFLNRFPLVGESTTVDNGAVLSFGPFTRFEFLNARSLLKKLPPLESIVPSPSPPSSGGSQSGSSTDVDFDQTAVVQGKKDDDAGYRGELLLICDTLDPVPLQVGTPVVVGRSDMADMILPDKAVSRRHAEFERRDSGVYVRDLGSSNGTLVAGVKLGEDWRRLRKGRIVMIGRWELYTGGPQSSTHILQMEPDRR